MEIWEQAYHQKKWRIESDEFEAKEGKQSDAEPP
jgi:hypothetical protein